jgi:mRNA interferase RelE/StbE
MAHYLLDYSRDAVKFLDSLPAKQYKQVAKKVLDLSKNPLPNDSILLKGYENRRRADIGEYRIIYEIVKQSPSTVAILVIDKRNDDTAYKKAIRLK